MEFIADLHIHGKYSRATSTSLDFSNLEKYAKIKGLNLLGTGDFSHPKWIEEIKGSLTEDENGILWSKTKFPFIWQNEISLVYTQDEKGRRVHLVLLAPNYEVVKQITEYLLKKGRVDYDGRPIFKIPCDEFTEHLKEISKDIEIIPAHVFTPWFGLLGSMSGFDSVEEGFKDQAKNIFAIESGLSSDPAMNWRLSSLDKYSIVSFSDLHSFWPWRIGREATVFDLKELSYKNIIKAIRTKDGLKETIEVDPNYGKYHVDGHRVCNVSLEPDESIKLNNICPVCKKSLTLGVLHRVNQLADRTDGKPKDAKPFKKLIPLSEVISTIYGRGIASKGIWEIYNKLLSLGKNELDVVLNADLAKVEAITNKKFVYAFKLNREGKIKFKPGYDGVYGKPIFDSDEQKGLNQYN